MWLLMPAFRRYGKRFIFNPDSFFSYHNIEVGEHVSIGGGATFLASESKIIIGNHVMFGPNVTIVSGNHNTRVIGKFMSDVVEKLPEDDQDVIIDDDVWVGSNVTILKGCHLYRGCIIAAGAVVNKDIPPYCIAAGVPAKVVKIRFDIPTILLHEEKLYPVEKRYSEQFLKEKLNLPVKIDSFAQ